MRRKRNEGLLSFPIFTATTVLIFAVLVNRLSAQAVSSNRYYVAITGSDSNPGTQAQPWQTISHAASQVKPGDTVLVAPGMYRDNVYISQSGTRDARIRFVSTTKWGAKIIGAKHSAPTKGAFPAVAIDASYIDLVGFDISAPVGRAGVAVGDDGIAENGSYVRIIGNRVHDVAGGCKLGFCDHRVYRILSTGGAGILVGSDRYQSHNNEVVGNLIYDIGDPLNPYNAALTHGIYIDNGGEFAYGPSGYFGTKAQNNVIYRIEGTGIQTFHCTADDIVTNNTVTDAAGAGIWVAGEKVGGNPPSGCINRNTVVANNIVAHNGWHTACASAMRGGCVSEVDHGGGCGITTTPKTSADARFMNNLSFGNRCGKSPSDALNVSGQGDMVSNNLVGANPQFVQYSPGGGGDYHLSPGSPAIDRGTSVDAPSMDFDGNPRPQGGGVDIGAYELAK
jgi:hypothetical protein